MDEDIVAQGDVVQEIEAHLAGDAVHFGHGHDPVYLNDAHGNGKAHITSCLTDFLISPKWILWKTWFKAPEVMVKRRKGERGYFA